MDCAPTLQIKVSGEGRVLNSTIPYKREQVSFPTTPPQRSRDYCSTKVPSSSFPGGIGGCLSGQLPNPVTFTEICHAHEEHEGVTYISGSDTSFDGTDTKAREDCDIGPVVHIASPPQAWMRLHSKGSRIEVFHDIEGHEGQDKQNQQGDGKVYEEVHPPSLLGPSQSYKILRNRPPPKTPLPHWASSTIQTKTIRKKNVGKKRAK